MTDGAENHLDLPTMVLDVVAHDYEDFPTVVREVSEWADQERIPASPSAIEAILRQQVADGIVLAYEYVASEQRYKSVHPITDIERLYFYASAAGREVLGQLAE